MKFRKAIGTIILNSKNQIIVFQRSDFPDSWQGPEGGIEDKETILDALYRELYEEVGLEKKDFDIVATRDEPFRYFLDKEAKNKFGIDGQEKYFFIIKLKDDNFKFKFDNKKDEIEFLNYKVLENNKDMLKTVPLFKENIYKEIIEYFNL